MPAKDRYLCIYNIDKVEVEHTGRYVKDRDLVEVRFVGTLNRPGRPGTAWVPKEKLFLIEHD